MKQSMRESLLLKIDPPYFLLTLQISSLWTTLLNLKFNRYLMETASQQDLWASIHQVNLLQNRASYYLQIYQKFVVQSQGTNEFLNDEEEGEDLMQHECSYTQLWQPRNEQKEDKNEVHAEQPKDLEEQIEFQPRRINLSRIFQDITLGDQVRSTCNTIDVQLNLQGIKTKFCLNKEDNSFNLSNFSSFNNQKPSQSSASIEIRDLLLKIQEKAGRQLNKKGIQSILGQIEASLLIQGDNKSKMQESQITRHSLKGSHINPCTVFTARDAFDFQLEGNALQQSKDKNNIQQQVRPFQKKDKPQGYAINQDNQRQRKENSQLHYRKMKSPVPSREIRIIRKNYPKNSLLMNYTDLKHLENFCISNKIYGKDKEKIGKAIRDGKSIVTLD